MFRIDRRGAVIGLAVSAGAVLAALLTGSAGAEGDTPVQRRDIVVRQATPSAPSVNLTSDDPGAVHGAVSVPVDGAVQSSATDRAPVQLVADDPTTLPPAPVADEPDPTTEAPAPPPPLINTPDPTPTIPASPENTPIQTPTLAPTN